MMPVTFHLVLGVGYTLEYLTDYMDIFLGNISYHSHTSTYDDEYLNGFSPYEQLDTFGYIGQEKALKEHSYMETIQIGYKKDIFIFGFHECLINNYHEVLEKGTLLRRYKK